MLKILTFALACGFKGIFICFGVFFFLHIKCLDIFEYGHVFNNNPVIEPFKKPPRHLNAVFQEWTKLPRPRVFYVMSNRNP